MASSRIFIKGLPPTISEDEFKNHFSAKHPITDAKLISHRRIGYVGYKTPEDAVKAVKYFNRSFIRMSKIGVEIARPISDATLPVSRKAQREKDREDAHNVRKEGPDVSNTSLNASTKRKRSDVEVDDLKLKEFLEVMQPPSKPKKWGENAVDESLSEPPTKMQAIEVPEAESDEEYEIVPRKSRQSTPPQVARTTNPITINSAPENPSEEAIIAVQPQSIDATDDDWLRSRTSRLLDLMDPEEIIAGVSADVGDKPVAEDAIKLAASDDAFDKRTSDNPVEGNDEPQVDPALEAIRTHGRLFVRNLPYTASEQDLRDHFASYGSLEEVHLPVDSAGKSKGFLLVQYSDPAVAVEAFHNLDGEPFQGRLLHILPAAAKREKILDEFALAKLPLKKQKEIKKKADASSTVFNWNSLYMNQDAVNSAIADRLGVTKSELLDPTSADAGVKQAIAETSAIQEAKSYFAKHGIDLAAFKKREKGDTAILVKNFPFGMTLEELRKMFEEYGQVVHVLMPPIGTIAIVEFAQPTHARAAFAGLAYRRIKDAVLHLEKAPKNLISNVSTDASTILPDQGSEAGSNAAAGLARPLTSDLLMTDDKTEEVDTTTLFVRNLNFVTTSNRLTEVFRPLDGFLSARVNTKTDPKKQGQVLSMGFGFLEFKSKAQAQAALKAMDGYDLDGHKLLIKASHKGLDAAEERRKQVRAKQLAGKRTKIIIKNLPFEASRKDVRALFGAYGQLRSVRLPKKFDHSTRGFAFADFVTAREAENALEALKDTHLLGRRLVLEFAASDSLDAEEEIEKMQKKVGGQVDKVALQKLIGGGRKKFNAEGNGANED